MSIRMIGIDHERASLIEREIFAFTPVQSRQAMETVVKDYGVEGCVIISTCNRTELWVSERKESPVDLKKVLFNIKHIVKEDLECDKHLFVIREGREAYRHLFMTACGLKSQIWGESQILSQIKKAIEEARKAKSTDIYIEKLFQMAITAAKKVQTQTRLTKIDVSVATKALEQILGFFPSLDNKRCLVIGNGEMGKNVAEQLVSNGAEVYITLRHRKHGAYILPLNCMSVDYDKRYQELTEMDVIVSVTTSPHYTITADLLAKSLLANSTPKILIDLAVPRDIDPAVKELNNLKLLDMDTLGFGKEEYRNQNVLTDVYEIIDEYIGRFVESIEIRNYLPILQQISNSTSERICQNMQADLESLAISEEEKRRLENRLIQIVDKAVISVLFGLKDSINRNQWNECFTNLVKMVR
ncbi:glutamyl-tRNA reductase [Dehalobacter sp. DCM]|uniref:glutamyl-tRNA reductase n=1 Tax=Dehalobacter sp. DCM TaxID=2907827 RepID=UPI00308214C4|nr:glutamyl-tRNA reductase [Dehalobacter sp. DCM]